jgi:hypothetical protein
MKLGKLDPKHDDRTLMLARYVDYAVLSEDWLGEDQRTPGGFDLDTLLADLRRVTS